MKVLNWSTERIAKVKPEEFYNLIDRNRDRITQTFPITALGCTTLEDTITFLQEAVDNEIWNENYYFYLRDNESDILIGYVVIKNIEPDAAMCELAYFIDAAFEGKGIITTAVGNTLDFCFRELELNKVTISTLPSNIASQKIALKHGFVQEGILRQEFKSGEGKLEDVVYFGLLKEEYNKNEK